MKRPFSSIVTAACLMLLAASANGAPVGEASSHHLDIGGMDRSVRPGDDFFLYANGGWIARTEIPADRSSYGRSAMLVEKTQDQLGQIMRDLAASPQKPGSNARKIADFYKSYMDEDKIEALGVAPLAPILAEIAAIKDRKDLARVLGQTLRADVDVLNNTNLFTPNLFGLWVEQDLDNPGRNIAFLLQGGLLMPAKDYYLSESPRMADIREKYLAHVTRMLTLADIPDAPAKARAVLSVEKQIAAVHWATEDMSDPEKGNVRWARADFDKKAPGLDWTTYFKAAGLEGQKELIAWGDSAIAGEAALVSALPLEDWQAYLTFHTIATNASVLPKAFGLESFAFRGTTLSGTPKQRDRWKRAVDATNDALGEAVGQIYVAKHFPPESKAAIKKMVANLIAVFDARIDKLDWMSPQTKAEARAKLKTLRVGVGYPDKWTDYSALDVLAGDAFGNRARAEQFELRRALAKLGKPVDRDVWVMNPQLVNAVNLPTINALNFPAAYLQPPTFDARAPSASNYAAVGATIGHEISHSFDNGGALFDSAGKMRNWWTPEDLAHFTQSGAQLVAQYDGYKPFADLSVNGKQTLGENIADVAGLLTAYQAYLLSLKGKPEPVVDGFTGPQQFFLSYAQSWRNKVREPAARQRLLTDGHAPAHYRALTVRNLDGWYDAFGITSEQALYLPPEKRVRVW